MRQLIVTLEFLALLFPSILLLLFGSALVLPLLVVDAGGFGAENWPVAVSVLTGWFGLYHLIRLTIWLLDPNDSQAISTFRACGLGAYCIACLSAAPLFSSTAWFVVLLTPLVAVSHLMWMARRIERAAT